MKNWFVLMILTLAVHGMGSAQQGSVQIEQNPKLDQLLKIYRSTNAKTGYYTIQVGFGNLATAERLKSEVEVEFPTWPSRIIFDSPTYRVQLGRFKERLTAERRFLEVREKFPASLLLKPER